MLTFSEESHEILIIILIQRYRFLRSPRVTYVKMMGVQNGNCTLAPFVGIIPRFDFMKQDFHTYRFRDSRRRALFLLGTERLTWFSVTKYISGRRITIFDTKAAFEKHVAFKLDPGIGYKSFEPESRLPADHNLIRIASRVCTFICGWLSFCSGVFWSRSVAVVVAFVNDP